ncbi:MAG: plasmid pRiA4b ORF-3 family protein [Bacteroidia bacterium]
MVYQIKVTLEQTKPPVWRRLLIQPKINFLDLHFILQGAMGWENAHLFVFEENKPRGEMTMKIGIPYEDDFFADEMLDAEKTPIQTFLKEPKDKLFYEYDFGDSWRHKIELEKILEDTILPKAICVKGAGACPPEDCGGIWGYYQMMEFVNKKGSKEGAEYREWLGMEKGDMWDFEAFDLEDTNLMIQEYLNDPYGF